MRCTFVHGPTLVLIIALSHHTLALTYAQEATSASGVVKVVAAGLTHPRGFTWSSDGTLYVALAGTGGLAAAPRDPVPSSSVVADGSASGEEVVPADDSAAVVRVVDGCPVPVVTGLPSSGVPELGWVFGVSDVAILQGVLYALVDGGGEAGFHPGTPNGVYRIEMDGTWSLIADLSAWFRTNPVAEPVGEITPDGEPFSMVAGDGMLWIVETNQEQILTVAPDGTITRVADLSPSRVIDTGVPTGIALAPEGGVYVGLLTPVPFVDGAAKVVRVAPDGTVTDVWTGLTAVTSIAVSPDGVLYASEFSTSNTDEDPFYREASGRVIRQTGLNGHEVVASGLAYPIHLDIGPDRALYVAVPGIGAGKGEGRILRLDPDARQVNLQGSILSKPTCPRGATGVVAPG